MRRVGPKKHTRFSNFLISVIVNFIIMACKQFLLFRSDEI